MAKINDQHIQSFYRQDAEAYDRERFASRQGQLLNQAQFRALDEALDGFERSSPILEVGFGTGRFLEHLEHQGWQNLTGVDQAPEMQAQAAQKTKAKLTLGDVYQLPFPDDAFEVVYSVHVMMHVEHPAAMFREMLRVSRRRVIIDMNNRASLSGLAPLARKLRPSSTSPKLFRQSDFMGWAGSARLVKKIPSFVLPLTGPMPKWYLQTYPTWSKAGWILAPLGWASQYFLVFEKTA